MHAANSTQRQEQLARGSSNSISENPRIYVGTYAKYNSGSIAGAWLDLEDYSDADTFFEACRELHADEADPELMFQDWENIPSGMISESHLNAEIWNWLDLDNDEKELLLVYREHIDQCATLEQAQDAYSGTYDSADDAAEDIFRQCNDIPTELENYIDWKAIARDMSYDGYVFCHHDGAIWTFAPT